MKRFYENVDIEQAAEGWQLLLDGKPARSPGKHPLALPTKSLAEALAEEWREQKEKIDPATMPLTQLACTALDITALQREGVETDLLRYGETDLVCYRDDCDPALAKQQSELFQPWLDWGKAELGVLLQPVIGVMPVQQPTENADCFAAYLKKLDIWRLTGLSAAVQAASSLVLGLALERGKISAAEAFRLSVLEEQWQTDRWGRDDEKEAKLESRRIVLQEAEVFLKRQKDTL